MSELKIRKSTIVVILIVLFPIFNLIDNSFLGYYDELIGLAGLFSAMFCFVNRRFVKSDEIIFLLLVVMTIIGLISNLVFGLANSTFGILIDVLHLWKTFGAYFLFKYEMSDFCDKQRVIHILSILARIIIIFMLACSLIGQVIDIGVCSSRGTVGPFKAFNFFWHNGIQTGWLIFGCVLVMAFSRISIKSFFIYYLCALVPMLLTGSMLVYSFIVVETVLMILWKGKRFKAIYLLVIGLLVIAVAWQDIVSYFINMGIRMQFYVVAISLATQYFPFGTGFATFGSEMAARYYSAVYINLGWANSWAFGTESHLLNDNFFAGILGQFGFIGLGLYLICLFLLFKSVLKLDHANKIQKITLISIIITICVVMLGSASAKSMMGIFTFALLGFFSNTSKKEAIILKTQTLSKKRVLQV